MSIIGVISDTHGLLRPEAIAVLRGVEMILHAGDIGKPEILDELNKIAPVTAVRGNNDTGDWARDIPDRQLIEIEGFSIYMLHDLKELDLANEAAGVHVVIAGHSHRPLIENRNGILYLNPGSAGPRRFKLPVTLGLLTIDGAVTAEVVNLLEGDRPKPLLSPRTCSKN
jgi:putative phosphoesterase